MLLSGTFIVSQNKQILFYFRTRDSEVLSGCEVVVDVGAVFDPSTKRFDHHQRHVSLLPNFNKA